MQCSSASSQEHTISSEGCGISDGGPKSGTGSNPASTDGSEVDEVEVIANQEDRSNWTRGWFWICSVPLLKRIIQALVVFLSFFQFKFRIPDRGMIMLLVLVCCPLNTIVNLAPYTMVEKPFSFITIYSQVSQVQRSRNMSFAQNATECMMQNSQLEPLTQINVNMYIFQITSTHHEEPAFWVYIGACRRVSCRRVKWAWIDYITSLVGKRSISWSVSWY